MLIVNRQFIKPYQIGSQIHHVFNSMLTSNNRQFITHTKSSIGYYFVIPTPSKTNNASVHYNKWLQPFIFGFQELHHCIYDNVFMYVADCFSNFYMVFNI